MANKLSDEQLEQLLAVNMRMKANIAQALKYHSEYGADDILQESALKAVEHISQFKGNSSFRTWYTRVVINTLLMALRKRTFLSLDEPVEGNEEAGTLLDTIPSLEPSPEHLADLTVKIGILHKGASRLTPALRQEFYTYLYESAGTSPARKGRRFRLRHFLKDYLTKRGIYGVAA